MYCDQCEQAAKSVACDTIGICGKSPEVSDAQDELIEVLSQLSHWANIDRQSGKTDPVVDEFVTNGLFSTITNVDFDIDSINDLISRGKELLPAATAPTSTSTDVDIESLRKILLYGVKGYAAYAHHAANLSRGSDEITAFTHKALAATLDDSLDANAMLALCLECGRINYLTMELLDRAHTDHLGHPEPTVVSTGTIAGKGILVSGHDLRMLQELLKQTEGKGINVYTHGEMLPAHGYPQLKKYTHLAGNYGGAWQDQAKEFPAFPGAIIFNTNCIQKPASSYTDRLFSWGLVQWPGVAHIDGWDFTEVINKALESDDVKTTPGQNITVGFGHNAVLGLADKVIDAVKGGDISHFFLVGGCDGAKPGRNYYTELAEKAPKDTVILTLACGKYRFNKMDLGDIGGIPRLLDVGQCNDAYSAIKIAVALAEAFECDVNELPLSLILSWYEQKAVAILLTLLHLGIKNIKLGPTLPAFVSPNVLDILVSEYGLGPITTAKADIDAALAVTV